MSRTTFRTLLALFAVALVAAVPAIASAHNKSHKSHKADVQNVGSIVSFADGTLVITSGGLPVSGKVTPRTRIKWADRGRHHGWGRHHHFGGFGRAAHRTGDGPGHEGGRHDWTDGGLPTGGGMPTEGGLPTGGGMPGHHHDWTDGGLPTGGGMPGGLPRPTTDDLKPGTIVRNAELKLTQDGPVWREIVLERPAVTPAT